MRKATSLAAAVAAAASLLLPGSASATTGDTYVLPPSQYVVPQQVMGQFFGSYQLASVGKGSLLHAGNIFITTNAYGDLYGGGTFYGYDDTGAQTDWTNLLYDFRFTGADGALVTLTPWATPGQVAGDKVVVTLYGWGSPSLGTLTLRRQPGGDLAGTIRLFGQSRSFPIRFHRTGNTTA
jgi:hypothetical protein